MLLSQLCTVSSPASSLTAPVLLKQLYREQKTHFCQTPWLWFQCEIHPIIVTLPKYCWGFVLLLCNDPILPSCLGSRLTAITVARSVLLLSHAFISDREGGCTLGTVHTHILHFGGSSPEWISGSNWCVRAVCAGDDSGGLPVWLVKVDIECSSPVCKHRFLRDEAVVAPSSAPLVGKIHAALVWARGLIVMIWHRGMRGRSTCERGEGRWVNHVEAWKSKCEGGVWK